MMGPMVLNPVDFTATAIGSALVRVGSKRTVSMESMGLT
jgi:hypothetical protein